MYDSKAAYPTGGFAAFVIYSHSFSTYVVIVATVYRMLTLHIVIIIHGLNHKARNKVAIY